MIDLVANFGGVIEGLAAADAYMSLDTNIAYYNAVIEYAFEKTDTVFNNHAAAYAEAGGGIGHMFEYGTLGVNRQQSNMRPQPTEERARLWKTVMINKGPKSGATVTYEFKPSVSDVPISTLISPDARAKMRRHQFTWKARILEENEPVTIRLKDAQFLLIPVRPGAQGFRPNDVKRGYTLTKRSFTMYPGDRTAGRFSAFWAKFWEDPAGEFMSESVSSQLQEDFLPFFKAQGKDAVMPPSITAAVKARSAAMQKEVAAKAKARRNRYGR